MEAEVTAAVLPGPNSTAAPAAAQPPLGGPAGPGWDVALCLLPVAFLLVVTLSKKLFMPTSRSLPYAAAMLWLIKMTWIGEDPIHITATVLQGSLLGLTPLSILFAAFVFFNALNVTQTMPYIAALVRATCCNHPVAEVFLVLWALGHLIEGASGFGTGPAMLPPIMTALGHPPFECLVCLLIMTTCVGPFGSSGIGLWFGLSALEWTRAQLVGVTFLVAVCMALMSYPIAWFGARFLLSWEDIRGCWLFVVLSITACALPALLAALFSFEAPGLVSGVLGVVFTGLLARQQLGLSPDVPCVVARRLKELEAGAAAAVDASLASSDGGSGMLCSGAQQEAPQLLGSTDKQQSGGASRHVIELTAVAADPSRSYSQQAEQYSQQAEQSGGLAAAWRQQAQPQSFRLGRQPSGADESDARSDAAQGLLQVLAAASHAAPTEERYPRPESAPAALMPSPTADGAELEDADVAGDDGSGELLPARAVRSHHDIAAYHGHCAGQQAVGKPARSWRAVLYSGGGPATGGGSGAAAHGGRAAAASVDAATSAYLSDWRQLALRLLPWGAMLVVVAGTRVPYLQRSNGHEARLHLRSLGDLTLSSNLVIQFRDLCRIGVNWSFALLYVPALLPFIAVGCATLVLFRRSIPADKSWRTPFAASAAKCKSVAPAIIGALILVALMVQGGRQAPSYIIGYWLSEWLHRGYIACAMLLGAVGSFFSGSVATSNMTFGLLQQVAAQKLGLNAAAMVMLQIVGGAAGQMVSISNILGGRAAMGLQHIPESAFIRAALPACLAYYVAGTALALPFLFS